MQETRYESLFDEYRDDSAVLRMEKYALWSLPTIFVDVCLARDGRQTSVERDYQSIGAQLVNSLSSKMTALLFPSNQSFFRLDGNIEPGVYATALGVSEDVLSQELAQMENRTYRRLFLKNTYSQLVHAIKLAIVTGNALLFRDSDSGSLHAYSLRQYSMRRDGSGKVLDIILQERTTVSQVPDSLQQHFQGRKPYDEVKLWTRIKRETRNVTDVFVVTQQLDHWDLDVHEEYPEAVCPYIPFTWNLVTGEDYGRGLVEDYAGDFAKLSSLSEALALYEIEACRVLHLAAPGAGGDIDSMATAPSGEWVSADPGKVQVHEAGDYNKIVALLGDIQSIYARLSPSFMYGGNVRQAERVTAEEIRQQAEEANTTLGGVYSSIADQLHIPLAHILCQEENPDFVAEVISGGLTLSVLTGVAALGRSADVTKLLEACSIMASILPVIQANPAMDPQRVWAKVMQGYGLDMSELQFTESELQARQQAQANTPATPADAALAGTSEQIQGVI